MMNLTTRFWRDQKGQFSVMVALFGLPLLLVCAYAVDVNQAVHKKTNLAAALDAAALASVIPANLDVAEREAYARIIFEENYFGDASVTLDINASRERVEITGSTYLPTFMSGIVGKDKIDVKNTSVAVVTREDVICVLALDPNGSGAVEFKDSAVFNSPACSVQVNSTSSQAIVSSVPAPPIAKSFCSSGESKGKFYPFIKHVCSRIEDPYAGKNLPPEPRSACKESTYQKATILNPGVFCEGLKIDGANVTFSPGIYHIWGELLFTSTANVYGRDVTFILKGTGNSLKIDNSAIVELKAPSLGPTAGLVFWQVYADKDDKNKEQPTGVSGKSEISASGGLNIVGTAYFPTQELTITSDRWVTSKSPATSFIAYRLLFAGKSNTAVHVDHEAGGIPPMLPRSDEGARLVH